MRQIILSRFSFFGAAVVDDVQLGLVEMEVETESNAVSWRNNAYLAPVEAEAQVPFPPPPPASACSGPGRVKPTQHAHSQTGCPGNPINYDI